MGIRPSTVMKVFWNTPPRDFFRLVKSKLRRGRSSHFTLIDLLNSPGLLRPTKAHDFLHRYEMALARHGHWPPLDFTDKRVLELGCGPLLGFAPLAIFLGCSEYLCVEPMLNMEFVQAEVLVHRYWHPLHEDLCALYGKRCTLDEFMHLLRDKVVPAPSDLPSADINGAIDISLSNSCLEHIEGLSKTLEVLAGITAPNGRFIHLVNFGSHRPARNPFQPLYSVSPESFRAKYGNKINMIRYPEMLDLFNAAGLPARMVPLYTSPYEFEGDVHPAWADRFSWEELWTKAALIVDTTGIPTPESA